MKPAHEIKIKDLLGDNPTYKAEWLRKGAELKKSINNRNPRVVPVKAGLFDKMNQGIDALKQSSSGSIKIYKNAAYNFDTNTQIKNLNAKKNRAVSSEKIEWKKEGSDGEMVFQVNFANSRYGGGTFGRGFVQEEIKNVLSTTASILTANEASLDLAPRNGEKPTPVVIVGQIKNFTGTRQLPYGWGGPEWKGPVDSMIKDCAPTTFNELAIAANELKTGYGSDNEQSVKALFNNALAGFKLAKEVADAEGGKSCKIKTGLFGAGAFHNSPEFSIAMQYLAARIAGVEIEFCGIVLDKHTHVEQIFKRVDEMISSEMSLDDIVKKELLAKWASAKLDAGTGGWRTGKDIPSLSPKKPSSKSKPQEKAEEKGKSLIDQWIVPYPTKFETSETGKAWGEAKNKVFEAFDSTLPWGKAAKDKNGSTIKWPWGFLGKISDAVVDLALTIAWGVFEYIVLGLCKKIFGQVTSVDEKSLIERDPESKSIEVSPPSAVKIAERDDQISTVSNPKVTSVGEKSLIEVKSPPLPDAVKIDKKPGTTVSKPKGNKVSHGSTVTSLFGEVVLGALRS